MVKECSVKRARRLWVAFIGGGGGGFIIWSK